MARRVVLTLVLSILTTFGGGAIAISPALASAGGHHPIHVPPGVYVAPDVDLSQPIVLSNGQTLNQDSTATSTSAVTASSASSCDDYLAAYGWPDKWTQYQWNCSYWGLYATSMKYYDWYVPAWSDGSACSQGLAIGPSGPYWVTLGCGDAGSALVPWENAIGIPKYQTISISIFTGAPEYWH